jgi:Holliday junction resolvase RusA-like endonuclease
MLTLRLPMPPSVNSSYANRKGPGKGRVATAVLRSWKSAARTSVTIALASTQQRPVFTGRVDVSIRLPVPTGGAMRDGDNVVKPTLDLLVTCGVIPDDNWRHVRRSSVEWVEDGTEGECVVIITVVSELPAGDSRERRTATKMGAQASRQRPDLSPVLEADVKPRKRPSPKAQTEPSDAAVVRAIADKLGVRPERVHLTGGGAKQNRI